MRPELVARIQFLEWTGADHLRPYQVRCAQGRQRSLEGSSGNVASSNAWTQQEERKEVTDNETFTASWSGDYPIA